MLNLSDFTKSIFGDKKPKIRPTVAINSREDLVNALAIMQTTSAQLMGVLADYNKAIAEAAKIYNPQGQTLQMQILQLEESIIAYCEPRKAELLKGCEGKTLDLGLGTISWYLTAGRVSAIPDEHAAIAELKALGLDNFVVVEETLDKNAIKSNWGDLEDKLTHLKVGGGNEKIKVTVNEVTK